MKLPRSIQRLIEELQKLPSIGPRTAERLTYFLLRAPQEMSDGLSEALHNLKRQTVICETCFNIAEKSPCKICSDVHRDYQKICVVEEPLDVLAIEKTGKFSGVYHVLGGSLNPIAGIGPEELRIGELLARLQSQTTTLELILATNPTLEGEATAMYIKNRVRRSARPRQSLGEAGEVGGQNVKIKITRIARGLPTGGDLEYADEVTVGRALEGRLEY